MKVDPRDEDAQTLCISCRLNRTIPDLSIAENGVLWGRLERAKRRVISSLLSLGLPVQSRVSEDPERGIAFDLLHPINGGPPIMTGHEDGVITLNIEEADDVTRERCANRWANRTALWWAISATKPGIITGPAGGWNSLARRFRELFGDDRSDYGEALRLYHAQGPQPDWPADS